MTHAKRPSSFWVISIFLVVSIVLMLLGQTVAAFNYDATVNLGPQESRSVVGEQGVQVNRAIAASDSLVYIPLMILSLFGLIARKRWALISTAAVAGISAYWSVTAIFLFTYRAGLADYTYVPGIDVWLFIGTYLIMGIGIIIYLTTRGESLLQ